MERIHSLEAQVFRRISPTVAHHVWGDDPQAFGGEKGDLISPSQRQIRPSVDQENSTDHLARRRLCLDVVVLNPVQSSRLILERRGIGGDYLHLCRMKTKVSAVGAGIEAVEPAKRRMMGETIPFCTPSAGLLAMSCVVGVVEHCQGCRPILDGKLLFKPYGAWIWILGMSGYGFTQYQKSNCILKVLRRLTLCNWEQKQLGTYDSLGVRSYTDTIS